MFEVHGELDQILQPLLRRAGTVAMEHFGRVVSEAKSDGTPVTEADRRCEQILVEGLARDFPGDAVVGEEGAASGEGASGTWYVDPIDGTGAFVEGLTHWCNTVARVEGGTVTCGAAWFPRMGDYFFFERGRGAFLNGRPLAPLGEQALCSQDIVYLPSRFFAHATLKWPGKARNLGSICAHLCLVGAGAARAAILPGGWEPWDTACGLGLIGELGGRAIVPADGGAYRALDLERDRGRSFAAGCSTALDWLGRPGHITTTIRRGEHG